MPIIHELLPTDITDDTSAVHDATALAAVLSVLADPTRLAILSHLRGGEHRVGELAEHLGLAQSTVSQHLAILRDERLVLTRREAQSVFYSLMPGAAFVLIHTLHDIYCGSGTDAQA